MERLFYSFFAALLSVLLFACGSQSSKKTTQETQGKMHSMPSQNEVIITADSDTINIPIKDGYGKVALSKKKSQKVYVSFSPDGYSQLQGKITANDSIANVRFTQIATPDGTMDGPFWNEITYNLAQKGKYTLSIGENMMAGDPWGGIFTVEIKLSR